MKKFICAVLFFCGMIIPSWSHAYEITGEGYAAVKKNRPSIAFVLTTWEKKGSQTTIKTDATRDYKGNESGAYASENVERNSGSLSTTSHQFNSKRTKESAQGSLHGSRSSQEYYDEYGESEDRSVQASYKGRYNQNTMTSEERDYAYDGEASSTRSGSHSSSKQLQDEFHGSTTMGVISEDLWSKIPDMQIVDRFQQEFKSKGFVLRAADQARAFAMAPTIAKTGIDPSDRGAVREFAEKENVNFVARGEAAIIAYEKVGSSVHATVRIGIEIIDVNSGDIVASYSNTVASVGRAPEVARSSGIVKMAIVAARFLAVQTMESWIDAAENGATFTIELRNVTSARSQKMPFERMLKSIADINSQTSPKAGIQSYVVSFKGSKGDLGEAIIEAIGDKKGFEEEHFDGPNDENGKIVFTFKK